MSTNPYQPPLPFQPGSFATTKIRPTSATVFGILNIFFGIFGICGVAFSAIVFFIPPNPNAPNPVLEIMAENAAFRMFNYVGIGLGFVATIVLIASGIGLLKLKPFGRTLAVGYGIYGILGTIVGFAMNAVFVFGPLLEKINTLPPGPAQAGAIGGMIGGTIGPCVGFIYPLLLLIFMYRRNVVEAYRA